jgi:hypothetical protein
VTTLIHYSLSPWEDACGWRTAASPAASTRIRRYVTCPDCLARMGETTGDER